MSDLAWISAAAEISHEVRTAHTLSRRAVQRRQWSRVAEVQGKLDIADKLRADAAEFQLRAMTHFRRAIERRDYAL